MEIDAAIGDAEVAFIDNLSTLARTGKENEGESWLPVQGWALGHRRAGHSIVLAHHTGKGGLQRGTSRREDVLDAVLHLRWATDYNPSEGARFEVHYEKACGFYGDEAHVFEAKYEERNGVAIWTRAEIAEVEARRISDLKAEGLSVREIAEELGISKKVDRLLKKASANGAAQ